VLGDAGRVLSELWSLGEVAGGGGEYRPEFLHRK